MTKWALRLAPLLMTALTGCGYHAGSLISADIKTVHVAMFDNKDFRHEIEFALTEAVKNEVVRRTHLKLADRTSAQSVLEGTILRIEPSTIAFDQFDQVFSQGLTVHVDFRWTKQGDGRVLASAEELSYTAQLVAVRGDTETTATAVAFRDLAKLIVERMQEDF